MPNKNVLDGAVTTINNRGSYALPAGSGQAIRRGADNKIYLYDTNGPNITSPVGLEQAKKKGTVTQLSGAAQIGQILDNYGIKSTPSPKAEHKPNKKPQPNKPSDNKSEKSKETSSAKVEKPQVAVAKSPLQEDIGATKLTQLNQGEGISSFNISNFRANAVNQDSILPKHSFLVTFAPFAGSQKASQFLNRFILGTAGASLIMRCDSAQLPGVTALKDEVRRFGYGPVEDSVYGVQFQDMTLGFILDQDASQAKFFDEWFHLVTNFTSKGGGSMMQVNDKSMLPYEVGYKDDYSNLQMNITVFDRAQRQVLVYEIYDVFPIAINATDVSWGDTDQMLRQYVRFAYTDYSVRVPNAEYTLYEAAGNNGQSTKSPNEEIIVVTARPAQGAAADLGGKSAFNIVVDAPASPTYISSDPANKTSVLDDYLKKNPPIQQNQYQNLYPKDNPF